MCLDTHDTFQIVTLFLTYFLGGWVRECIKCILTNLLAEVVLIMTNNILKSDFSKMLLC